jgi:hypothetical protein
MFGSTLVSTGTHGSGAWVRRSGLDDPLLTRALVVRESSLQNRRVGKVQLDFLAHTASVVAVPDNQHLDHAFRID